MADQITIIDYGMGNLRSVKRAIDKLDKQSLISSDLSVISSSDKLILPGVGHFANAVKNLKKFGIWDVLNHKVIIQKTPILGICLGMQLMAKHSEEGDEVGFGWIDAEVKKIKVKNQLKYKIPHIGWNRVVSAKKNILMNQIPDNNEFYFLHSFYIDCNDKSNIISTTEYEMKFTSAVQKDNIYGVQFHPEKSNHVGWQLLNNFLQLS